MTQRRLSEPNEDYLERICELLEDKGYARVSDIGDRLGVKPASVSRMLQKLEAMGYVVLERYRGFTLTPKGKKAGQRIRDRHAVLQRFLSALSLPQNVIDHDIEGLEHHLSDETVAKLKDLLEKMVYN